MIDATKVATKRLREMPRDWPEQAAERLLKKLETAEDRDRQVDLIARQILWAYMKGRGTR